VGVLSTVSLAQDAASEMLYPVLPLLLTTVLGAPAAIVGVVEGIAEGAAAAMKYAAGWLSDRRGRKPLVAAGYGLAAVGKIMVAAAGAWPVVLAGRVVDRTGKGIRSAPRDALLTVGVPDHQLGRVFGFHRAMDTAGAVLGPVLGLAVLALADGDLRVVLWVAVAPAVVSVLLVALARDSARRPATEPGPSTELPHARSQETATPLPPGYRRVVGVLVLIALVNFPDALALLRLVELGFTTTGVVAAYVLYNLVYAAVSYPAGALADRLPKAWIYALGLTCFAVGYLGLAVVHDHALAVLLILVYGGFNGLTDGVGKAWVSSLVPPQMRGRAQGLFQGASGAAVLAAGLWAGLAWNAGAGGGVVPLVVSGAAAACAAAALALGGRRLG
jgi:MFS family permease